MKFHYVKVWDGWVRMNHWLILVLMAVSFATAKAHRMDWHMLSGYAILTLLLFRLLWGLFGSDTARFSRFMAWPGAALRQLGKLGRREPDAEVGHNAAGGWMVLLLLALLLTQAVTGLFTYDQIFTRGRWRAGRRNGWLTLPHPSTSGTSTGCSAPSPCMSWRWGCISWPSRTTCWGR